MQQQTLSRHMPEYALLLETPLLSIVCHKHGHTCIFPGESKFSIEHSVWPMSVFATQLKLKISCSGATYGCYKLLPPLQLKHTTLGSFSKSTERSLLLLQLSLKSYYSNYV